MPTKEDIKGAIEEAAQKVYDDSEKYYHFPRRFNDLDNHTYFALLKSAVAET
jgi:hypothetical protein